LPGALLDFFGAPLEEPRRLAAHVAAHRLKLVVGQ
jgi:hypothetical protein